MCSVLDRKYDRRLGLLKFWIAGLLDQVSMGVDWECE